MRKNHETEDVYYIYTPLRKNHETEDVYYIYTPFITKRNGHRLYAKEVGLRAFRLRIRRDKGEKE